MLRLLLLILGVISTLFGAKLKAPLLSFGASGKLAGSLVFFPWKGINAVRTYVIPANPRTDDQLAQRTKLENAVDEWHGATYTADDVTAWNRLASLLASAMSGFNRMCQEHINQAILGNTWTRIRQVSTDTIQTTQFGVGCYKAAGGVIPRLRWGISRTHLPNSVAMTDGGDGTWHAYATSLSQSTLYYFSIDVGVSGATWGRVGLYQQRTAAA